MRGSIGRFTNPSGIGSTVIGKTSKIVSFSAFSTSSGDGFGRGRGRGASAPPRFDFVAPHPGKADLNEGSDDSNKSPPSSGLGHGRGKPMAQTPFTPSIDTYSASNQPHQQPGLGRGRGGPHESKPKMPIFFKKDEVTGDSSIVDPVAPLPHQPIGEKILPESILNVLTGGGRGKPLIKPVYEGDQEENRHLRPRQAPTSEDGRGRDRVKMSRDDAVKKAVGILSKREADGGDDGRGRGVGRGRGRGRGRGDFGRGRGRRWRDDREDDDDDDESALYLGDDKDAENLAKGIGPELMNELTEAFEEMGSRVLPDPLEDEYIEALDTNLKIELEPEYLMGEFGTNPDIDEKLPIPLREALEKMKPFLMAYEGIENQEEWEEVVKEAMERVPLLKEIVDHYCGPDRVTAKQQQEELERVAKTVPLSIPDSVKRFTNRAVLSLQSNPGWGFDRKCQFMDKLVHEVSKSYK